MVAGLDRRVAVATLMASRGDALVVSGLGSPSWDVHAAGDVDANYYLWGAMGGAALVGLGIAMARPERRVMVVTGDGEHPPWLTPYVVEICLEECADEIARCLNALLARDSEQGQRHLTLERAKSIGVCRINSRNCFTDWSPGEIGRAHV